MAAGFDTRVGKSDASRFHPHLTLLKSSRGKNREEKKARIAEEQYAKVADLHFGTQVSSRLQLCSMSSKGGADGLVITWIFFSVQIDSNNLSSGITRCSARSSSLTWRRTSPPTSPG